MHDLHAPSRERGIMQAELLFGLLLLALGVLAAARVLPVVERDEARERMCAAGNRCAQEKLEELRALPWDHAALAPGRHPGDTAVETIGGDAVLQRYYVVTPMSAPIDYLKAISVIVRWTTTHADSVTATTYVRRGDRIDPAGPRAPAS